MASKEHPQAAARLCDEIAELARKYLEDPRSGGIRAIDQIIVAAQSEARWDDLGKWHRVRLRYMRLQNQRRANARLMGPSASYA